MQRLGQSLIRYLPLLSGKRHIGTCGPCISVIRIDIQALVYPFLRLQRILLLQIDFSLESIGIRIILPLGNERIQFRLRHVIILALHLAERTVEPVITVARLNADGRIIIGDGILEPVLTDTADGTQVVDIVDIRIEIQRLRRITLSSHIIIEIKLGDTSVIPRLIEIRLGTDSKIKILDGKNEVLIIESTSACRNQAVNSILR